ncbi:hypothetical protein PHA77_07805 [Edwardsiella tarda]|uniref:hypothetical protein n=1 Tax=Edwardsiella tarda TaxID=636 RepID=UPI002444FEC0|nr:hypothetical protein [Edwardsiella tarda]WGE30496.1 hypothetical protein PHA77_07805 [Edwardsiella tarda]
MKTFRGLSLNHNEAFLNIATLINAALLIDVTEQGDCSELSDCILIIARQYAEAAHEAVMEE